MEIASNSASPEKEKEVDEFGAGACLSSSFDIGFSNFLSLFFFFCCFAFGKLLFVGYLSLLGNGKAGLEYREERDTAALIKVIYASGN